MSTQWKFIASLLICAILFCCSSCSSKPNDFHQVQFFEEFCIKPKIDYIYQTCNNINVQIDGYEVEIPKGFNTDLASVPRWYWSVLAPNNTAIVAPAILHDYLYTCDYGMGKDEIDEIFYYALLNNAVPVYVANQMYYAVKLFGQNHYHPKMNCGHLISMD